jgi:TonB family protein
VSGVRIETTPSGAAVLLDGKAVGTSPLTLDSVPPGTHALKVSRDGYSPAELGLEMTPAVSLPPLRFALQPLWAELAVLSQPAGATIRVDEVSHGATPLARMRLEPGDHRVKIERPGFQPWTRKVDVQPGETLRLEAQLQPAPEAPTELPVPRLSPLPLLSRGDLVALGPGVTPPQTLFANPASYPPAAARAHMEGVVIVDVIVTETGEVVEPRVIQSAGEILDAAALSAVRRWRFTPAEKDGVKVKVHLPLTERFERQ